MPFTIKPKGICLKYFYTNLEGFLLSVKKITFSFFPVEILYESLGTNLESRDKLGIFIWRPFWFHFFNISRDYVNLHSSPEVSIPMMC